MNRRDLTTVALTLSVAAAIGTVAAGLAPARSAAAAAAEQPQNLGEMLTRALRETEGCLGADNAQWDSGRASVVGWFESKEAVLNWYHSAMHERLMTPMGGASDEPMAHIPDDQGPIMVIATITPSDHPEIRGFPAPISQVSIELFAPLPGGAFINGRLSPEEFEVEHMRDLGADDGQ